MKNLMKITLVIAALIFSNMTFAQTPKFGYINSQELLSMMPEIDSVNLKMETFQKDLEKQFEEMQVEFNKKYEDYSKNAATMSQSIREYKEKELSQMQTRLQEFNAIAQRDLQNQMATLMKPVVEKARQAIHKAAKANNITMVFDLSQSTIIYHDQANTVNMLPLIKAELKLKAAPTQPAAK
jgi:outer membrane protein